MSLVDIREDVMKFASTISRILHVDVMIVDPQLNRIANTFLYAGEPAPIRHMSIIGQVIISGQVTAIKDKRSNPACQLCPDYKDCTMTGFIGVPILYKDRVAGAIALIVPDSRVGDLFHDVQTATEFLEGMAGLIASKLANAEALKSLSIVRQEQEVLMDSIENAIVSTDEIGYIKYYNKKAERLFGLTRECIGQYIRDALPSRQIQEFLAHPTDMPDRLVYIEANGLPFHGFLSCLNISINGQRTGILFSFRPLGSLSGDVSKISADSLTATFDLVREGYLTPATIDIAKRFAISDRNLLITGEDGSGAELLAKAIHNFSDRSERHFAIIDCGGLFREALEQTIFGSGQESDGTLMPGKLQIAHKGTVCIHQVNRLPLYLQQRLVAFLKSGILQQAYVRSMRIDVRLIFTADEDLESLVAAGLFDDELYYRISESVIAIRPLRSEPETLARVIDQNLAFCKQKYDKDNLTVDPAVIDRLRSYDWPGNIKAVEQTIDRLVAKGKGRLTLANLEPLGLHSDSQEPATLRDLEKERISQLLAIHQSKEEVARILNIGRATLYRKIKEYQINPKERTS